MAMTRVGVYGLCFWLINEKKMFGEYSTDGPREKLIGIFCKSYLPIGKKRLIFAVLLRIREAKAIFESLQFKEENRKRIGSSAG